MLRRQAITAIGKSISGNAVARRSYASAAGHDEPLGPSFSLSDEQQAFQELARQFTKDQITPVAAEHDRTMQVNTILSLCPDPRRRRCRSVRFSRVEPATSLMQF